jgi:sigma-54-interacting transcriptional regulator
MQQTALNYVETAPLLLLWVASQRPGKHLLVECDPGGFEGLAAQAETLCAPPVRWCRLPGPLQLPDDRQGTLLLNDVAALSLQDQITLYDWLGHSAGDLRVISGTTSPMAPLLASGRFLEGLFNRLGNVQFDVTSRECAR